MAKASSHPTPKKKPDKPTRNRSSRAKLAAQTKIARALELRLAGHNWDQIAQRVGYASRSAAYSSVMEHMARRAAESNEDSDQLRALELDRMDRYLKTLDPKVKKGDPRAISIALRVGERRARLLGLDATQKHEIAGPDGGPVEIRSVSDEELIMQLQAALAALAQVGGK